ncbi:CAP domain-containing protein [Streptomyces venezuelae]|uniref:CAP domain-containing protein n=1 Tax=Streptomyces venezuelae TaxID=54571 RepID=UPI001CCC2798|nr:CAP domain-containing protein [Streptomyces venezuelae]
MRQSTVIERDTELVAAACGGDPWARDQLVTAHLPLIRTTVGLALSGRQDAGLVEHVVRETMLRALDGLDTLTDPRVFRPWLVAIAVDGVRRHRHAHPAGPAYGNAPAAPPYGTGPGYEISEAARWLDPGDAEQLALWWLERAGELTRYETAAASRWSEEELTARVEALRGRLDAARVVAGALAATPACPALSHQAAGWDGRPSAPWRDHLAHHTVSCGDCATRWTALVPAETLLSAMPAVAERAAPAAAPAAMTAPLVGEPAWGPSVTPAPASAAEAPGTDHTAELTEPYLLAGAAEHARPPISRHADGARAAVPHGSRAALRHRRRTQERGRRRAVIAAGVVAMAVTGGAFSLHGGRGGDDENLEANHVAAPELDLPVAHDPSALSGSPTETSTTPAATPSASATTAKPSASASPSARLTTPPPRPARTTAPARATTAPPRTTKPTPDSRPSGPGTGSDTGTETGTGAGRQNDQGQSSAADQVIALVNQERAKAGCGPLTANATLARAAQGHSDDMAARDFFDHTNPDGADPGDRVTAAGYPWSTYGENIAMGQSSPESVMEAWMNSPGHRANILNCSFKEIGIGIHSQGGPYWTQVFGAR